jgi:hypothetical protein
MYLPAAMKSEIAAAVQMVILAYQNKESIYGLCHWQLLLRVKT